MYNWYINITVMIKLSSTIVGCRTPIDIWIHGNQGKKP